MDPAIPWIVPLTEAAGADERLLGGKAAKLAQLAGAGFRVPPGFCITTSAYEHFLHEAALPRLIRTELGRKPFESMRWEEIWDTALRIRSAFLNAPVPAELASAISLAVEQLGVSKPLAVRSSAPGEDSANRSFAGLHESVVGVVGIPAVLDAAKVVWASLWSDAALLYRQELSLDPASSRMAIVVQEMIDEDRSGVAFGRDPRQPQLDRAVVEAVPGPCGDLVDGLVDPDRWIMDRATGQVLEWRPGLRDDETEVGPLLIIPDLDNLLQMLLQVEALFAWAPDTEWTGRGDRFTLLQARPITTAIPEADDTRAWYLTLRPTRGRLAALAERVAHELIPNLEALGQELASEPVEEYDDLALASAITGRHAAVQEWRQVYLDEFIPFAHGVRQLGIYYNDAVHPEDPYEFVGLLRGEQMVASQRNQAIRHLARQVREHPSLATALWEAVNAGQHDWKQVLHDLQDIPGSDRFGRDFEDLRAGSMDIAFDNERLSDRTDLLLRTILEMAGSPDRLVLDDADRPIDTLEPNLLEQLLLDAVGPARRDEALQVLTIGRLSWRLRDDDNLLVGRLESQLLRALNVGADRLRKAGRLRDAVEISVAASLAIAEALRDPWSGPVDLPTSTEKQAAHWTPATGESPRQLVGQPAAPGLATGRVRVVRTSEDLGLFRAGEALVCDAIQPTMTHLVPLACAIVERRGGMLIHGAIIARELGIPCVNGIAHASELLDDGEIVTVDGFLGIVTVGPPEFDLEASN
jgi:phosphohistidine swiveling domain-containing protein